MVNATITGNISSDPRIGEYNGRQMANANVAVHTPFKDANGNYITNFYDITVWGPQRDILARMKKGNKIAATGSVCVKTYNKKDGTLGLNISMNATSIESLTPKSENGYAPEGGEDPLFSGN